MPPHTVRDRGSATNPRGPCGVLTAPLAIIVEANQRVQDRYGSIAPLRLAKRMSATAPIAAVIADIEFVGEVPLSDMKRGRHLRRPTSLRRRGLDICASSDRDSGHGRSLPATR
jgi:hypothetical protein